MKLFKLDLLTLLISLFILSGCEPSDEVGLEIDPANAINGTLDTTVTIKSATVPDDEVKTNLLTKYPLGYFNDPVFGITDAKVVMSLNLPSSSLTFGTAPVLDSAVLVLKYATEFYGDSTSIFDFEVHQLNERLTQNTNFLNTHAHPFVATIIGGRSSAINIKDSVRVGQIIKGKPDSIKKQVPQLRIPINAQFINNNFFLASSSSFKDNNAFNAFIRGLYLTAKQQGTKAGGIVLLDLGSAEGSKLELYYKTTTKTGTATTIDTNLISFPIQNSIAPVAATFTNDYRGKEVQTQLDNSATEYSYTFIQPLAGVRTQVNFTDLDKLKSLGNIIINKAELVLSVANSPGDLFKPAPRIFLYTTDIAGQRKVVPDIDEADMRVLPDVFFGGFYKKTPKKSYTFTLTAYIQDLLSGKLKPYNLYINSADPSAAGRTAMNPLVTSTGRVVIGSGKAGVPYKMKLNIIYTKVN